MLGDVHPLGLGMRPSLNHTTHQRGNLQGQRHSHPVHRTGKRIANGHREVQLSWSHDKGSLPGDIVENGMPAKDGLLHGKHRRGGSLQGIV